MQSFCVTTLDAETSRVRRLLSRGDNKRTFSSFKCYTCEQPFTSPALLRQHILSVRHPDALESIASFAIQAEEAFRQSDIAEVLTEQLCAQQQWSDGTLVWWSSVDLEHDLEIKIPDSEFDKPFVKCDRDEDRFELEWHAIANNPVLNMEGVVTCWDKSTSIVVADLVRLSGGSAQAFLLNQDYVDEALVAECFLYK